MFRTHNRQKNYNTLPSLYQGRNANSREPAVGQKSDTSFPKKSEQKKLQDRNRTLQFLHVVKHEQTRTKIIHGKTTSFVQISEELPKTLSLFIDKVVEATGYDRKRAIRLLNRKTETYAPRGAHRKLRNEDVELIRKIWANCGYPNALYLKHMLPRFLKDSIEQGEHIGASQMKRVLRVSYKTPERELSPYRVRLDSQESTALKAAIKAKVNLVAP